MAVNQDAIPTTTTTTLTPTPTPSYTTAAGASLPGGASPSAQQIEDLNFYLRRMTMTGNGDISQIESFGGGPDFEMFLEAVNSVGTHYGWSEAQKLRTIEMKLKDKARQYYVALLPSERPKSMEEMRNWLRRVFERKLTIYAGKRELEMCIRIPGEPLGEYAQRLKVVANKMFPANTLTSVEKLYHRNMLLVNQFIEGLEGRLANEVLRAGEFYNLDECLAVAEGCEEIVSRMVYETKYDLRMSNIRRIQSNSEDRNGVGRDVWSHLSEGRREEYVQEQQEPNGNGTTGELISSSRQYSTDENTNRRQNPNYQEMRPQRGQFRRRGQRHGNQLRRQDRRGNYQNSANASFVERFPYMKRRCTRCGEEGHLSVGCVQPKQTFCFHCGKVGEICSLNFQRQIAPGPR